jgi:hypothetical protein
MRRRYRLGVLGLCMAGAAMIPAAASWTGGGTTSTSVRSKARTLWVSRCGRRAPVGQFPRCFGPSIVPRVPRGEDSTRSSRPALLLEASAFGNQTMGDVREGLPMTESDIGQQGARRFSGLGDGSSTAAPAALRTNGEAWKSAKMCIEPWPWETGEALATDGEYSFAGPCVVRSPRWSSTLPRTKPTTPVPPKISGQQRTNQAG